MLSAINNGSAKIKALPCGLPVARDLCFPSFGLIGTQIIGRNFNFFESDDLSKKAKNERRLLTVMKDHLRFFPLLTRPSYGKYQTHERNEQV